MKIGVIGAGYVGLVTGVGFADAGHHVLCTDSNGEKIKSLIGGVAPFFEPGLQEMLELNQKRIQFTSSLEDVISSCSVLFLATNTPERDGEQVDTSSIFDILAQVCRLAKNSPLVVLKSTVPLGTARRAQAFALEQTPKGEKPIRIVANPEFLRQGSALKDFLKPDRIVIGCEDEDAKQIISELYSPIVERGQIPLIFMDHASAELTKYAANALLATKISFINEMALLADRVGADIESVRTGLTMDHRIGPHFLAPGLGYGGSCFSKDLQSLLFTGKENKLDLKILSAVESVNERQKRTLSDRVRTYFGGSLQGKTIGLWGLAFKPKTDDVRRAPSLDILRELFSAGAALKAYDPVAAENAKRTSLVPFETSESAEDAARGVDALLILTEWSEFRATNLENLKVLMRAPVVFDGRNLFEPKKMKEAGFYYSCIGREASNAESSPL